MSPRQTLAALSALLLAGTASAVTLAPSSYSIHNGAGQASGGTYNYWDLGYTGSGATGTDNALLSGGLGDLTDGVVTTGNWFAIENAAGTGPYVGWRQSVLPTLALTFNFAGPVNLDSIGIHADDSAGFGGVSLPSAATVTWAGGSASFTLADPDPLSNAPSWLQLGGLGAVGISSVTVQLQYTTEWIFVDEVSFAGAVPEPTTAALLLAGVAVLGAARRRRG